MTPTKKHSTLVSALALATTLAIPFKSLAIEPANHDLQVQSSDTLTAFASPEAIMVADTYSSSAKAGETSDYPAEEKSAYPATETALAQSGYDKDKAASANYLPWWRWLTLAPVLVIFLWSFFTEDSEDVQYHADQ